VLLQVCSTVAFRCRYRRMLRVEAALIVIVRTRVNAVICRRVNAAWGVKFEAVAPGPLCQGNNMKKFIVVLALSLACLPALAQKKMYRCGNVFQERPCEGPKAEATKETNAADPQKRQEAAAKREEKEKKIRDDKCKSYGEELADVRTRLKVAENDTVKDQLQRRQKEMDVRIARECGKT
jgi:hypothetical protein